MILAIFVFFLAILARGVMCQASCQGLPNGYSPAANSKLPDPFTLADGTKVTTQAQWTCRQQEISQIFQQFELGTKPPKPSSVTSSFSSNSLTIMAQEAGKSISFSVSISYPSGGQGPYPAIIAYGYPSIPISAGVATITFNNDDVAAQVSTGSRGQGKFYNLYGSDHSAGAMTAWAWGVSRIIDALEDTPAANIDPKRVGVTGCSRNGKGAFVAGALDDRIALTIPQESGAGGAACWRISDSQKAAGKNIQTASQIVTENVWFSSTFQRYSSSVNQLPEDHHMLAALVAPRGLLVLENDIDWLGPVSTTGCMKVGRSIYSAVGAPDAMGFSLIGGHNHCQFPSSQQPELSAFIDKYLLGGSLSTANVEKSNQNVDVASWVDWTAPTLS
ncbi:carbohydrate esterase family 15 protein [Aplosporella prunicola CBS 121167]|uniref:(4-O-methyl)-D-glucuronate--lignin esterase n=1 Tax=Aplosporella prunicola CBS 121167 TaxID=1176127 RepID=A0A6A6AXG3_9PEZI|nr:carbohydrate esterase family 15 protein [Aplosporella prunicola CBS 121167]KAF2135251.1 carbohydrate esterase family 15 protein [Aplosporella prunicola CBS 121167]